MVLLINFIIKEETKVRERERKKGKGLDIQNICILDKKSKSICKNFTDIEYL